VREKINKDNKREERYGDKCSEKTKKKYVKEREKKIPETKKKLVYIFQIFR
jgi:hypothetical protein